MARLLGALSKTIKADKVCTVLALNNWSCYIEEAYGTLGIYLFNEIIDLKHLFYKLGK